jgi:hypothetical protein
MNTCVESILFEYICFLYYVSCTSLCKYCFTTLVYHLLSSFNRRLFPGRWLRITVFLVVTSPYTAVYDEIRHGNGPYSAVILVTVLWHRIQHRILCRIRSYAYRILITNGRKTPAWITVKIRCVNGPYVTVYGRISAVFFDQGYLNFHRNFEQYKSRVYSFTTSNERLADLQCIYLFDMYYIMIFIFPYIL